MFFTAFGGTSGFQLWKSDGTAAGTVLVKDLTDPDVFTLLEPDEFTGINGMLFFTAIDSTNGVELWKSDGTAAGTALLGDIYPGSTSSFPRWLTRASGSLFFSADDLFHGRELWALATLGQGQAATEAGNDVVVEPKAQLPDGSTATVTMQFDQVVEGGTTTVTTSSTGAPPPDGFKLGNPPVYYDVSTTATFSGNVDLCFSWQEGQVANENNIRLFHYENGAWVDITTSVDKVANVICGVATSLSPFVLAEIEYGFGGIEQPVNADGTSIFKSGRTIPLKFQLRLPDGSLARDVVAQLCLFRTSATIEGTVDEELDATSVGEANEGNRFRYDPDAEQYVFNLATKDLSSGTYRLDIVLDDGRTHSVALSLR